MHLFVPFKKMARWDIRTDTNTDINETGFCIGIEIETKTVLLYAAVPQARKASLARFLEKRKERYD